MCKIEMTITITDIENWDVDWQNEDETNKIIKELNIDTRDMLSNIVCDKRFIIVKSEVEL